MKVLALDIASVLGWAEGDGGPPEYGSVRMGRPKCSAGEAYLALDEWLLAKLTASRPGFVVYEAPILGRGSTAVAERLMGMAAISELVARKFGVRDVYKVENSTVMKHFVGRGGRWPSRKEKKQAVINTCRLYGWSPTDDNAADALGILFFAQSILMRGRIAQCAGPLFSTLGTKC